MRLVSLASAMLLTASTVTARQLSTGVIVGGESTYVVRAGDTATSIAGHFGMSVPALVALNRLAQPRALTPGQLLAISNPHLAIVDRSATITINIPQRMLFIVDDERISGYPITVGQRSWPTPLGTFTITEKKRDPVWHVPLSIQKEMQQQGKPVVTRVEPSPENPLGSHWLRLSIPGLGIHGTNAPSSIYRYASHGCVRMHPDDVATLFERVAVGTTGVVIYEPIVVALIDGRVWLEAHPDPYRRAVSALAHVKEFAVQDSMADRIDWARVAEVLRAREGRAEDVTVTSR